MKKNNLIKIIAMIIIVSINLNIITADDEISIETEQTINTIENQMQKLNTTEQVKKYKTLINIITIGEKKAKKPTEKEKYKTILDRLQKNLERLQNGETEKTNITNIIQDTINNKRLDLHNQERTKLGLSKYTSNSKLQYTAQKRANYLAEKNDTVGLHKRKTSDGYYNYESIKQWFKDNGVEFPAEKSGIANFSENIARQTFKCSQSNCTDYFLGQINKSFDFFMSEKGKSYQPHYKAIISKNFQEIGVGYAKNGNKFFIVTHYGKLK